MRLLSKIVLILAIPAATGIAGAALALKARLQEQRAAAAVQAAALLDERASELAQHLDARRRALLMLAQAPLLRDGAEDEVQAVLRAWAVAGGLFEAIGLAPGAEADALQLLPASAGQAPRLRLAVPVPARAGQLPDRLWGTLALRDIHDPEAGRPPDSGLHWLLLDQAGRAIGPVAADLAPLLPALGAARPPWPATLHAPGLAEPLVLLETPVPGTDWRLAFLQPESHFVPGRIRSWERVGLFLGTTLLMALFAAWLVRRQVTGPLARLARAHQRVQDGDLGTRMPAEGDDELAELARSFNGMVAALQSAHDRFRTVFEAFPHPVVLSRLSDDAYLDVNPAFEADTGIPRAEALGRDAHALGLVDSPARVQAGLERLRETGRLQDITMQIPRRGGRPPQWVMFNSRVITLDGEAVALTVLTDVSALKAVERRLQRSEQNFIALFQSAPLPMSYTTDPGGDEHTHWNQAWYRAYGYPSDRAEGRTGVELGLWVEPAQRRAFGERLRASGRVSAFEARLRCSDGTVRDVEVSGEFVRTAEHRLLMAAFVDVTPVRQAMRAAQASQARLQAVFEASPLAIVVVDAGHDFRAVTANEAWYRLFRRQPDEVLGRNGLALKLWADESQRQQLVQRLARPGDTVEAWDINLLRGDGSPLRVRLAARRFRAGDDDLVVMVQEDITERLRAEQALNESRELLAHTFDLMPEPLCIVDGDDGRFIDVNRAWVERVGLPREAVIGRNSFELGLFDRVEDRAALRDSLPREGRLLNVPVQYHLPSGEYVPSEVSAAQTVLNGRRVGIWMVRDISERERARRALQEMNEMLEARVVERTQALSTALDDLRRAQAELVRSEKLASLGSLVAGVAHELNTPIGNAVMVASTLADRQREFEAAIAGGLRRSTLADFLATAREAAQVLNRNLQRAAELVGSFKQLAVDQSSYQRRRFELAEVLQEVVLALSPTLRRSMVVLQQAVAPGLVLDSYPGPLSQVLVNLITNALTHAFEPGAAGTIRVHAQALGDERLCLRLADDGRGIAPEHLERIFDPFFTTRLGQGGSGLGLHIVYTLVTGLLGGRIEVHSRPGEGCEFVIELPLVAPAGMP